VTELDLKPNRVVGDVRLLRTAVLLEVNNIVLGQQVEVVVDIVDIAVKAVAGQLQLTPAMIERCDQSFEYGPLHVHLLSLTDIFVFKSITEREGDLEDAALIARQADLDWEDIFQEIQTQEDRTGQFFSFAVLDTIDVLDERHDIVAPITDRLVSYCLENCLLSISL